MSALDLDAVCARHGITLTETEEGIEWCADDGTERRYGPTRDAAVCTLLKDGWGICIDAYHVRGDPTVYTATVGRLFDPLRRDRRAETADTELAAVVALADRLAVVRE